MIENVETSFVFLISKLVNGRVSFRLAEKSKKPSPFSKSYRNFYEISPRNFLPIFETTIRKLFAFLGKRRSLIEHEEFSFIFFEDRDWRWSSSFFGAEDRRDKRRFFEDVMRMLWNSLNKPFLGQSGMKITYKKRAAVHCEIARKEESLSSHV